MSAHFWKTCFYLYNYNREYNNYNYNFKIFIKFVFDIYCFSTAIENKHYFRQSIRKGIIDMQT